MKDPDGWRYPQGPAPQRQCDFDNRPYSMHHYTYVVHNHLTGEYYIGIRSSKDDPHLDSYMGSPKDIILREQLKSSAAWSKYVIGEYSTRKDAVEAEGNLIKGHLGNGACLNRSGGGTNWRSMVVTTETRQKLSTSLKGKPKPKLSATQTGRTKTDATRAKIAASQAGRVFTDEHRRKLSEAAKRRRRLGD